MAIRTEASKPTVETELTDLFQGEFTPPVGLTKPQVTALLQTYTHQRYYDQVTDALYGNHRQKALFVWLGRAIGTVKPNFDQAALHPSISSEKIEGALKTLCEAIELFCVVAIMLDDCIEKIKTQAEYNEFVEPLYIQITAYLRQSYGDFLDRKNKNGSTKTNRMRPAAPLLKLNDTEQLKRLNYSDSIKYWIDLMFRKLSALPNFGNEEIKGSLFNSFQAILESSRFSRTYDLTLKNGTIEDLKIWNTNLYIESAKGGMGTQCMIPMAAMLLRDEFISSFLRITTFVDGPGRLANDKATIVEEAIGVNANTIFHDGLIKNIITLEDLRGATNGNVHQVLNKLLEAKAPETCSPVVKTICDEWEKRVVAFHRVAKSLPSELHATELTEGHFWFLALEMLFHKEEDRDLWINGLRTASKERVQKCLQALGKQYFKA